MHQRVFHDERRTPPSAILLAVMIAFSWPNSAHASGEIKAAAGVAVAKDPSGQKAAATAGALLRSRLRADPQLRLIAPTRVLSGDPQTREEGTLERARAALADGRRAYDALALDDAIARLGQAVALYQKTGPLLGDLDELATALAYLGASLVLRGSADEGESTFLELLTVSPSYQLTDFPPSVTRIFSRALQRVDGAPAGGLEIYSTPPYAAVFLDGRYAGVTPLVVDDMVAGTHYVRLEKLGYRIEGAPLEVAPNQRITHQTRLRNVQRGAELRDLAARGVADLNRPGMGGALRSLARRLVADTLIFVGVSQSGRDATFTAGVFDGVAGTRIATQRIVLAVNKPNFRRDLGRYLDRLVAATKGQPAAGVADAGGPSAGSSPPKSGDPERGAFGLTDGSPPNNDATGSPSLGAPAHRVRETPTGTYVGWSLVGAGGLALITGGVFGGLALAKHSDFNDTPQNSPDLNDIQDDGNRNALIADVLFGVGGAAVAAGVATLLWLEFSDPSPSELFEVEQAGLTPTTGGAVVSVGGSF